jgi:CheY-like chemotaxis protein
MMILLVDDDELVRTVLAKILNGAGHRAVETVNPVGALGLPEALGPPDVLIADVDLRADLNGFEVASYAHHLWPTCRLF